jgi:hypothetical protein
MDGEAMNCPADSICIVYPAWYLIGAIGLVVLALLVIVLASWWFYR